MRGQKPPYIAKAGGAANIGGNIRRRSVRRVDDHRFPVAHRERDLRRGSRAPGQRDDRVRREHVDVISRERILSALTAVGQVRANRKLDEFVRIAVRRYRGVTLRAGDDADAQAASAASVNERTADGPHHTAASARHQVYFELGEKYADL